MREISIEQIQSRIRNENPWWDESRAIPESFGAMSPREYIELFTPLVLETTKHRALVLLGPRRVGKTVLIHHSIEKLITSGVDPSRIFYCSIDNPIYNGLSLEQLVDFYADLNKINKTSDEIYVFFDEIQYLKDWERHLKVLVDSPNNLRFIVSGSAAAALRLKSQESGAGRFTQFLLPPLTFYEYLKLISKDNLIETTPKERGGVHYSSNNIEQLNIYFIKYLNVGGYPEIALTPELQMDPGRFIKSDIVDKVLLRDLPSLYGIQDIQELNYLFTALAFNTANEVSLESLSKSSGVAKNTIKRYIEYLEAAFLIKVVHRVDRTAKRFKRANFFKVYLTNPSIRAALFSPIDDNDRSMGDLVETAIFSQWFHSDTALYYARWNNGEVDIVYIDPSQSCSWVVEAKWTDRFFNKPGELKGLKSFCQKNNPNAVLVTTKTETGDAIIDDIEIRFKPAAVYAYELGANIVRNKGERGKNP